MKSIVFVLLSFLSTTSFSQPDNLIGRWTNGFESYESSSYNDSMIVFCGGNLHEGDSAFILKVVSDSKFIITGFSSN